MKVTVEVTAEDIARGARGSPSGCPVALAVCRAIGTAPVHGEIDVDPEGIHLRGRRDFYKASRPLPDEAQEFIGRFDRGLTVEPFAFSVAVRLPRSD
jgi:hypothetical protein